jgi:hypothetical protein
MNQASSHQDYYQILGATEQASAQELERLYKRRAAHCHPDKGGNVEEMKSLNEAYSVLKNHETRKAYDGRRAEQATTFSSIAARPAAAEVGLLGQGLSAFFCLLLGMSLLLLVRSQWIWFLWPLAILAMLVILFGIMMARGAARALAASLPVGNAFRVHTRLQEVIFWSAVAGAGYGVYLLLLAF